MNKIFFSAFFILVTSIIFLACKRENNGITIKSDIPDVTNQNTLFTLMDAKTTGIDFINKVNNTEKFNIFSYRNFYNGGGVAIGDINNDGLSDVYMTANMGQNKLYLNKGNFKFQDISNTAFIDSVKRWSTGVVFVDINSDGWLDIYVCNAGYESGKAPANHLYINNKDQTFTERAKEYGLDDTGYTTHAAFFDYDKDGDLDAYILNNSFIPVNTLNYSNKRELRAEDWDVKDFLKGGGDKLLRNDNGKFNDVSAKAGIYGSLIGFGLGISVSDVNNDNWPDIYISNDFFEKDYLYINNKKGGFKEELEQRMGHISQSSMGSDVADINNDGFTDIFATDMLPDEDERLKRTSSFDGIDVYTDKRNRGFYNQYVQNTLQLNDGNANFKEIAFMSGVYGSDWSWGALIFDADNDGWQDLIVSNGIYKDVIDQDFIDFFADEVMQKMALSGRKENIDTVINKMPSTPIKNKAYKNLGNLKFNNEAASWGLDQPGFSNGAAYGDLDNDGDLDLIINNVNQESFIYKNNNNAKLNSVVISLKGQGKNTFAIGAKIKVTANGKSYLREIMPSRGFQSSVDYKTVVGIEKSIKADTIQVLWPDGKVSYKYNSEINKVHEFNQSDAIPNNYKTIKPRPLFAVNTKTKFLSHKENNDYKDFHNERGLYEMISKEGPAFAKGDLNNDGLDDLFIGAAKGQKPQLYMSSNMGYTLNNSAIIYEDFEDTAAVFFDADKDGDLDLFVGSGGNHQIPLTREMQDRIYINDGKNKFILSTKALPTNGMNTSVAVAMDYDKDGDNDLFVGSRSVPLSYGIIPSSYLYQNDGNGMFKDVAITNCESLSKAGFITSAAYVNIDEDKNEELILSSYWGGIKIYKNNNGKFVEMKTELTSLSGMWNYVGASDLDNDGDQDLVLGNDGTNSYLSQYPMSLWIGDFDDNSTIDKIVTRNIGGKNLPIMMKREFMEQLPSLKKNSNIKHQVYASKSLEEILQNKVSKAQKYNANFFESVIMFNEGNLKFKKIVLPNNFQVSAFKAAAFLDVNNDGFIDIIPGGNKDTYLPQFGRLDAFCGDIIINEKGQRFSSLSSHNSGLNLKGEVRHMQLLKTKSGVNLFVVINNESPRLYEFK
jgi:enediyne biosynthesis protein E4